MFAKQKIAIPDNDVPFGNEESMDKSDTQRYLFFLADNKTGVIMRIAGYHELAKNVLEDMKRLNQSLRVQPINDSDFRMIIGDGTNKDQTGFLICQCCN